ncbi:hypothetical protein EDB86DRAFT_398991 [Lactarius hatsudake]|nr:hypothetical protein EDB86DRAFT_398991 [Lactarius hatsudake]
MGPHSHATVLARTHAPTQCRRGKSVPYSLRTVQASPAHEHVDTTHSVHQPPTRGRDGRRGPLTELHEDRTGRYESYDATRGPPRFGPKDASEWPFPHAHGGRRAPNPRVYISASTSATAPNAVPAWPRSSRGKWQTNGDWRGRCHSSRCWVRSRSCCGDNAGSPSGVIPAPEAPLPELTTAETDFISHHTAHLVLIYVTPGSGVPKKSNLFSTRCVYASRTPTSASRFFFFP